MKKQHEPLRVPQGWTGQDKALIIQLERLLNELYSLIEIIENKMITDVAYDSTNKKIQKTYKGTTADVVSVSTIKSGLGAFTHDQLAGEE